MKIQEQIIEKKIKVTSLPFSRAKDFVDNLDHAIKYCGLESSKGREMELLETAEGDEINQNKEFIIKILEDQKDLINQMSSRDLAFCSENTIIKTSGEGGSDFLTIIEK